MATRPEPGVGNVLPDLSLVLFGNSSSVKFGHANILLGEEQTNIENAKMSRIVPLQRKISGRHVSVINMIDLHETELYLDSVDHLISQLVNENEIHAFIFVVRLGQLTDADKMGLEWLQRVFGEKVLQFVMILFTYESEEECDTIIDDLKKNPVLEQLLEKCGGRYQTCNKMMNNQSEMRDLMNKIEHLFNENQQQHCTGEIYNTASIRTKELGKNECESEMDPNAQLNLILLGKKQVGKSATGNTILGREAFVSKKSSKSVTQYVAVESGAVNGFPVTVYDTPGISDADMSVDEIQKILQECESSPSVILLVIKADSFTEEERKIVEKIEKLLGEKHLQKTWILFTRGDELEEENITIQEFINDNEKLRKLVQKYDQRYHVFNNKIESTGQTRLLLANIFKKSLAVKDEGTLTRQIPDSRAKAHNEPDTPVSSLSSRRIVLLGKTGFGKSASGNTILGQNEFKSVMRMNSVTSKCSVKHGTVFSRSVSVVDTPGFFDTKMKLNKLMKEIARSVYLSSPGPHAFLILLKVNDRFTEHEQQIPQVIEMMFGEEVLKYSIILFTHGDQLKGKSIEKLIEGNSRLRDLVQRCGGRYHVFNNEDQSNREQVKDLLKKIDTMIEQNGGGHYSNQMYEDAHRFRQEEEERRQREEDERKKQEKQRQEEIERVIKETERIKAEMEAKRSELERLEAERLGEEEERKQQEKQIQKTERVRKNHMKIIEQIEARRSELERLVAERLREEEKRKQQEEKQEIERVRKEKLKESEANEKSNIKNPEFKQFFRKYRSNWYMALFTIGHMVTGELIGGCIGGVLGFIGGPVVAGAGAAVGATVGAAVGALVSKLRLN